MKSIKFLVAGAMIFTATTATFAQDAADNMTSKAFSFGVKAGLNLSTVTGGENFDTPDYRTGFHAGVVLEQPISDMISIQGEALYSNQGFKTNFEGSDGDDAEFQLDYINVPIMVKVYVLKGLSIEAGPQFSFLVNDKVDVNPNSGGDGTELGDLNLDTEHFDFGVAAGLTFQTEMGIFASGRYSYGLTEIYQDSNLKNSVFQVSLGYKFKM